MFDAYVHLHQRCGSLSLERLLSPAIDWAERGIVVGEQLHRAVAVNRAVVEKDPVLSATFLPSGEPLPVGSILKLPDLAATYRRFAASGSGILEDEWLIERLVSTTRKHHGLFTEGDFIRRPCLVEKLIEIQLGDFCVVTSPLPTQGYVMLQNLALYDRSLADRRVKSSIDRIDTMVEIFVQTFRQRAERAGDPDYVDGADTLLDARNIDLLYQELGKRAPRSDGFNPGDTTYFNVIDADDNAVSWIQSISFGFGSGVAVPDTGIIFNSRLGRSATLNPADANCCSPGKRPLNTIFPYLVERDGRLLFVGGTPGGDAQAQWNSTFLAAVLLHGDPIEEAMAAPRFTYIPSRSAAATGMPLVAVDDAMAAQTRKDLEARGRRIVESRAEVDGCMRVLQRMDRHIRGFDDGREEGLTLGR